MIDIHSHILPGVDDGAEDWEDARLMAELAEESKVEAIICTPHSNIPGEFENYWDVELQNRMKRLQREISDKGISLQILPGAEIYATDNVAELIKAGRLVSLNFTKYYLIEFGFQKSAIWMTRILASILNLGVIPVVAHPERYGCVQREPEIVEQWIEMGCRMQINKGSMFGRFGHGAWKTAGELLFHRRVSYVASDAHGPYRRTTYMANAYEFLCEEFSKSLADRLLIENPQKLIHSPKTEFLKIDT